MKRRTLTKHRGRAGGASDVPVEDAHRALHHNVYVVLLNPAVGRLRKVRAGNPNRLSDKPCVYVGMTGLTPEERFANHKAGLGCLRRAPIRASLVAGAIRASQSDAISKPRGKWKSPAEDLRRGWLHRTGGHCSFQFRLPDAF
jgi:hypothetical protein